VTVIKVYKELPFNGIVSINNLREVVSESFYAATSEVSELLRSAGVRHTVVGGVAVSCNGFGRTTRNIDMGVGKCAFEFRNKGLFIRPDLPVQYLGIPIHYIAPSSAFEQAMLEQYLVVPAPGDVPILPIGPLVVMKLIAKRHKDLSDIVELVKRRINEIEYLRTFVADNLPSKKDAFDALVADAENEMIDDGGV
jgi:hypothetical protein